MPTDSTWTTVAHPHLRLESALMSFLFRDKSVHSFPVCPVNGHCACHWVTRSTVCLSVCSSVCWPCQTPVSLSWRQHHTLATSLGEGQENFPLLGTLDFLDLCIQERSGVRCAGVCWFNWLPAIRSLRANQRKLTPVDYLCVKSCTNHVGRAQ